MYNRFRKIILFFSAFIFCENVFPQLIEWKNFGDNPGNLSASVHSPVQLNDSLKYPLVIVLHGCSQNAKQVSEQSGWSELADSNRFYVLYPEQKISNNVNRCFNWFFKDDIQKGKGEVESIHQMLSYAKKNLNVDTTRIFIYGLSAGAAMSLSVLSCYPAEFNAGAILAGGPYNTLENPLQAPFKMRYPDFYDADTLGNLVREQNPHYKGKYPNLIVLHGLRDHVVNHENANEIVKQWTNVHQTDQVPDAVHLNYDGKMDFTRYEYMNQQAKAVVILYHLKNLGHKLPVDPGTGVKQGGKRGLFAEDVDIFSTWYIADDFGLLK